MQILALKLDFELWMIASSEGISIQVSRKINPEILANFYNPRFLWDWKKSVK